MNNAAKRILIVEANEDHTVGGSHQAMFDLVNNLDRARFEPTVLFYQQNVYVNRLRGLAEVVIYDDVRREELNTNLTGNRTAKLMQLPRAVLRRAALLRELRIDLVHINNSPRVGNDDWLPAARLIGIPCIANAMGDAEGEPGLLRRFLFRGFDHVLPISGYMHEAMLRAGIHPRRLSRVDLGVDIERVHSRIARDRTDVRREVGVVDDALLAVMVGNIRPWKGQHVVIEALRRAPDTVRRRLHVAFVGATGPEYEEYERELRESVAANELSRCVSFLGPRHDVPDLFNAADLALHASVIPEPFGLVVIEALALGVPVIATSTGGPAEILTQDCGIVYDVNMPGELTAALERLVSDDALRDGMRHAAAQRAAYFSIQRYVNGVTDVYALCTGHRARRLRRVAPRSAELQRPDPQSAWSADAGVTTTTVATPGHA